MILHPKIQRVSLTHDELNNARFSMKCPRISADHQSSRFLSILNELKEFFRSTLNQRGTRRGRMTGYLIISRSLFLSQNSKISSNIFGILCNEWEDDLHQLTSDKNHLFILILRQVSGYSRTGLRGTGLSSFQFIFRSPSCHLILPLAIQLKSWLWDNSMTQLLTL